MSRRLIVQLVAVWLIYLPSSVLAQGYGTNQGTPAGYSPFQQQPASFQNLQETTGQPLTLRQAIYLALQQSDVVNVLSGTVQTAPTTAYDPQIARARIYEEAGQFDPRLDIGYEGSQINRPPNSFFGPGIQERTRRDEGNFTAEIEQRWITGTTVTAGYDPGLGYLFLPQGVSPGEFNPAHSAVFEVGVSQPLMRGAGIFANTASIQIARAQEEQSRYEFEEVTNQQVRSVCEAYWNLQAAYQRLKAIDAVIPLAEESRRIERLRFEAERTIYADLARAEVQLEEFVRQKIRVSALVRERAFVLNQLLGLSASDLLMYEPVDPPFDVPLAVDLAQVHQTAVTRRPELMSLRKIVDAQSLELGFLQNQTLPELDLEARYWTSGIGDRLDDALDQSAGLNYTSWTVGLNFSIPLGNHTARSRVQAKELEMVRDRIELRRAEERVRFEINEIVNNLSAIWQRYESALRQRQQAVRWLQVSRIRYSNPPEAGADRNWLLLALADYQTAMQTLIDTNTEAADLLAEYNILLARLDEAQGVSRDRWQVNLVEPSATTMASTLPTISPAIRTVPPSSQPKTQQSSIQQTSYRSGPQIAPQVSNMPYQFGATHSYRVRSRALKRPIQQAGHSFRSPTTDYRQQ